MKSLIPSFCWPLNIFQLHGTMCCNRMFKEYGRMRISNYRLCYQARAIYEANVLLLWGSISNKLASIIAERCMRMKNLCFLVHLSGCKQRVDSKFSSSSLAGLLPINLVFSQCGLAEDDVKTVLVEARKCLRA